MSKKLEIIVVRVSEKIDVIYSYSRLPENTFGLFNSRILAMILSRLIIIVLVNLSKY